MGMEVRKKGKAVMNDRTQKKGLSAESGDDCGAAVPAAQKVGAQDGRRDARTTNLAESAKKEKR